MTGNRVTLVFAGDDKSLQKTFASVGAGAKAMEGKVKSSIDAAGRLAVPAAVTSAGLLGAAMAPALGAALAGGVVLALGGGVLAAGIIAAAQDPGVSAAFAGLGTRARKSLAGFAEPFKEPLKRAAETFGAAIERMAPTINALGAAFAPLVDKLAPAIAAMAEHALPGLASAAQRAVPAFEALAGFLPKIGQWIGDAAVSLAELAQWGARNAEAIGQFLSVAAPMVGIFIAIVATIKIWVAAQAALNVVMSLNPIGLVIIAIAALVAVIVVIATRTTWFQDLWSWTWRNVKATVSAVWDWLKGLPGMLASAWSGLFNIITWPFRSAFNFIARAWNNTVGRLSWTVPGWVPIVGGNTISAPKLPTFHSGGVVPGPVGSEMLAVLQAGERVIPASGGGTTVLELRSSGTRVDDLLVEILQRAIKGRGGDVQTVLGR